MSRNEIGDEKLLLTRFLCEFFKQRFKFVIGSDAWLHHLVQRSALGMFRRNLEISADMMGYQLFNILRGLYRQVIAQARGDQHFFDAGQFARFSVQLNQR